MSWGVIVGSCVYKIEKKASNLYKNDQFRSKNEQIINIEPIKKNILKSILEVKGKKLIPTSNFSKKFDSAEKFYKLLHDKNIWKISLQKQFIDVSNNSST